MTNKTNYTEISSLSDFTQLTKHLSWDEAFIKESHLHSPSHLYDSGVVATNSKLLLRIAICLPENNKKIIELKFEGVEEFNFHSQMDITPSIVFRHNEIEFRFLENSGYIIRCRNICYRWLQDYLSGDCPIYTDEDLYFNK